jgi:N4-gp56 family major capsid protein
MALTITATDTELQKPVNVAFSQTFLRRARQKLPYYMGTQPGVLTKQAGTSTIKWRRIEQQTPSVSELSELTGTAGYMQGRDADVPTFTDVVATVAKYGQFYIINEEVDLYNPNGTMRELIDVLGEAAGRSMNQLQRNISEDDLTQRFSANGASDGVVNAIVVAADLQLIVQELWTNSARTFNAMTSGDTNIGTSPLLDSYWAICHPHVAHDVAGITGFKSVETYVGQTRTVPGEFGYYARAGMGLRFVASEDASIDAGAGAPLSGADLRSTSGNGDLYTIVMYGKDCLGSVGLGQSLTDGAFEAGDDTGDWEIIIHKAGSGGTSDPFNEISTVAWKSFHAGAVLNPAWGRALRVAATDLTN